MNNHLIEKYWNGETSIEEEAMLVKENTGSHSPESQYFAFLIEARKQKSMLTFDDIEAYNLRQTLQSSGAAVRPLYRLMASAAAILILVLSGWGLWQYSQQAQASQPMAETYEDPYEAYEEVREALAFVSSKLNKSQNEALASIQKASEYAEMFK